MNPYPYLNGTGWCTDPELVMVAIIADYCACEYSATKLYRKMIRSLPYQLMRYTDPMALANVMQEDLQVLFKNHFDGVQCTVNYSPDEQQGLDNESPRFRLEISLIVNDGVKRYTLAKILNIHNQTILSVGESSI